MNKLYITAIILVLFFAGCKQTDINPQNKKAKYVFFFIGDGMGLAHVNLTEAYLSSLDSVIGIQKLTMSEFPVFGMATTFAENRYITGSAAAGTALATGFKTSIGTIGLKSNHTDTIFSIAYYAKQNGMKVGILSSVGINHATPAAFYAHQSKRNQYYEIALQLAKSNFDVFAGGGFIDPKGKNDSLPTAYKITENKGYKIAKSTEDFNNLNSDDSKVMLVSPVLLSEAELPYYIDQPDDFYTLADYTKKSIELLDNKNGFFMMVEGGKIDWAAHANDGATVVQEVIDFDNAVKVAYDFYLLHPDETLIVVTADHETGGLAVGWDGMHYESNFAILKDQKYSLGVISDSINYFLNSHKNITFDNVLSFGEKYLSMGSLTNKETNQLLSAYNEFLETEVEEDFLYENINILAYTWIEIFNQRAGIGWTSHSHTGLPVPVRAIGAGSELFDGYYDNTDIPKKIAEAIGIKMIQ
ncbi:MAG: alkaline phosphatase [Bacteroidales bacterium]|nr:alkaline phosphatase [Bacteroidales bacterium]